MTLVVNAALDKHVTWLGDNEQEKELLRCFRNVEKLAQEQQEILGFVDQFQDLLACIEAQQSCGKLYITSLNESPQEVKLDDVQFAWDGPKNQLWSLVAHCLADEELGNEMWQACLLVFKDNLIEVTIAELQPPKQQRFLWFFGGPLTCVLIVRKLKIRILVLAFSHE